MTLIKGSANINVLVVEDEPLIRMSAVDLVESAGFSALEAADADEAVRIIESSDIDIVFTDIDMPGSMDGLELAKWLNENWPSIHIIIASGRHVLCAEELPDRGCFFSKPYDEEKISEALKGMVSD
ncbi:response regulator [Agrobacterium sp. ES01]|uniref:response regulator n=1 Tax=Agrobacterium sp. ES01 TaxID=3420714 RepID=UPI003D1368DC